MSKMLTISISDKVFEQIKDEIWKRHLRNKSEFVEELIRVGLTNLNPPPTTSKGYPNTPNVFNKDAGGGLNKWGEGR